MRLPFLQIDNELIDQVAPELAALLDEDELRLVGGLARMIRWALGRVPDGALPSDHCIVGGPNGAKLLARAAGHTGEAERFVDACCEVSHPVLERCSAGIRVRGLGRYDETVAAAQKRADQARKAAEARWGRVSDAGAMPEQCPPHAGSNAERMPGDANTQTQTQTHIQKPPPPTPAADPAPGEPLAVVVVENYETTDVTGIPVVRQRNAVRWHPTEAGCWEGIQLWRGVFGLPREGRRPKGFSEWFAKAISENGPDGINAALIKFLTDPDIKRPGHPTAVFIHPDVYEHRAPPARSANG